jgi:hypothetical protein
MAGKTGYRLFGRHRYWRTAFHSSILKGLWALTCLLLLTLVSPVAHAQSTPLLPIASLGIITSQVSSYPAVMGTTVC